MSETVLSKESWVPNETAALHKREMPAFDLRGKAAQDDLTAGGREENCC